jgi:hypothetical protein
MVYGLRQSLVLVNARRDFRDTSVATDGLFRLKGKAMRQCSGVVLSQQVRALIGEGNQMFVDNNAEEAMRMMQNAIQRYISTHPYIIHRSTKNVTSEHDCFPFPYVCPLADAGLVFT